MGGLPATFSCGLNLHRDAVRDSTAVSFNLGLSDILPVAPEVAGRVTREDVG